MDDEPSVVIDSRLENRIVKYFFNSIRPKAIARSFVAGIFLLLIVYFLIGFPLWIIPVTAVIIHLVAILYYSGYVKVTTAGESISLKVNRLWGARTANEPVQGSRWWSYQFEVADQLTELQKFGSQGNDLYVFVELTPEHGDSILFAEYIGFDTRFPNECEHEVRDIGDSSELIGVQRADRLWLFLERSAILQVKH